VLQKAAEALIVKLLLAPAERIILSVQELIPIQKVIVRTYTVNYNEGEFTIINLARSMRFMHLHASVIGGSSELQSFSAYNRTIS
jgi:predicted nucleic acid-binding protein